MKGNYLVAVCDILGFSDLVDSHQLDHVVGKSLGDFRKFLHHSFYAGEFPENVPPTSSLGEHSHVGFVWFSDTVFLFTKEDSDDAARELFRVIAWLLFETMIYGTRIRAGIAYGEAFIDATNSIYVGAPIIEAYQLEKKQQWAGAALTPSALLRVPEYARSGRYADWWLIPYSVPLKAGEYMTTLAVNWNLGDHAYGWRLHWSKDSVEPTERDWSANRRVCEKFMNTKKFHEANCHFCQSLKELEA